MPPDPGASNRTRGVPPSVRAQLRTSFAHWHLCFCGVGGGKMSTSAGWLAMMKKHLPPDCRPFRHRRLPSRWSPQCSNVPVSLLYRSTSCPVWNRFFQRSYPSAKSSAEPPTDLCNDLQPSLDPVDMFTSRALEMEIHMSVFDASRGSDLHLDS
ncbi:uncharacterized protein K489DRAFT_139260 [Dissoconium aciculare CBS 342.82]|uniref:Uncharacterized protein n=1 Tax=Dissoconium aciculare CBS 342.82 TaxID=1314786 RepID=A0A6J3LQE0_9PEZI|nr:uncharacterized protein K489DRAFT_139260 [Dissoconium aciculare CBS 342.82]KAF1817853.1 hypothetical protein K489DRAFT_139260 [Dissoconium aciculare CBS 342.82]